MSAVDTHWQKLLKSAVCQLNVFADDIDNFPLSLKFCSAQDKHV